MNLEENMENVKESIGIDCLQVTPIQNQEEKDESSIMKAYESDEDESNQNKKYRTNYSS
jgi:hypothetical protein